MSNSDQLTIDFYQFQEQVQQTLDTVAQQKAAGIDISKRQIIDILDLMIAGMNNIDQILIRNGQLLEQHQ